MGVDHQRIQRHAERFLAEQTDDERMVTFLAIYAINVADLGQGIPRVTHDDDILPLTEEIVEHRVREQIVGLINAIRSIPEYASITGILLSDGSVMFPDGRIEEGYILADDDNLLPEKIQFEIIRRTRAVAEEHFQMEDFSYALWYEMLRGFAHADNSQ